MMHWWVELSVWCIGEWSSVNGCLILLVMGRLDLGGVGLKDDFN